MDLDIYEFYDSMEKSNILLSFKGEVTSDLLTSILQIMESKMDNFEEKSKTKKRVYNRFIMNNIKIIHVTQKLRPQSMSNHFIRRSCSHWIRSNAKSSFRERKFMFGSGLGHTQKPI